MTDFVAVLARKWCPEHGELVDIIPGVPYPICACRLLAAAISEALEAAEKIAMRNDYCQDCTTAERIAADIAALRQ